MYNVSVHISLNREGVSFTDVWHVTYEPAVTGADNPMLFCSEFDICKYRCHDNKKKKITYFKKEILLYTVLICLLLLDTARIRLESLKNEDVNQCYTFVTEYDEESSDLPYWMQSIGRTFII